jgi:acyl homoserine lactone synthase
MASNLSVVIKSFGADDPFTHNFWRFRKRLFVDRLGWQLHVKGDCEFDEFDNENAIYAAIQDGDEIVAGFRAIRSDSPYLARSIFPQLATDRAYPNRADCWEISRFGIDGAQGNAQIARANYSVMFRFALRRQASALIAIADLSYERYLATLGITTLRYGPPSVLGIDARGRIMEVVAGEIPLTGQASPRFLSLLSIANTMEINDETLVLGCEAISA